MNKYLKENSNVSQDEVEQRIKDNPNLFPFPIYKKSLFKKITLDPQRIEKDISVLN